MKSKSVVLMVASLGFGLIAAIGISQVMGNNSNSEPAIERGQVLVAMEDLKHGDDLTEENVRIEHWPLEVIPAEAARDFAQIKHKKIATRLSKSLPIMIGDTANPNEIDQIEIPKGYKLIALKVSAEETFDGLLKPGDRVDVIGVVTVRNQNTTSRNQNTTSRNNSQTVSKTFLKNIEVYSVGGKLDNMGPREATNGKGAIVSVLVNEQQSEMIVLVQKVAKLRLVLRGNHEEEGDWEEFTDYNGFYESVFGKPDSESGAGSSAVSQHLHVMRTYMGNVVQEVRFEGNRRISPDEHVNDGASLADSDDSSFSDENKSNLEEDQYPGE